MSEEKCYAYFLIDSKISGIVFEWEDCQKATKGFANRFKSFNSYREARQWIAEGAPIEISKASVENVANNSKKFKIDKNGIFCDSGTGGKIGTEIRVTDFDGNSLLAKYFPKKVNVKGNINLGNGITNNYGELSAFIYAIEIAKKLDKKNIYSDSNLIIEYWSKGRYNANILASKTIETIKLAIEARKLFEEVGGKINFISGDFNPADLGHHKKKNKSTEKAC